MKRFRATHSYGATFGMDIDAKSESYREMKKNTKPQTVKGHWGIEINVRACPFQYVAGIMREAGWLVAENQAFRSFQIDGGEEIFIIYPDGIHI